MALTFEHLGKYIRLVDERNTEMISKSVLGINIDKFFMPSVANVIGTDLSNYKLLRKGRFACNPMHVGRDGRLPVSLYLEDIPAIVSPAYFMFEIIDESVIEPDYLMLCFRRSDFDRMCWFRTDASVRGGITWEDICSLTIPVLPIDEQKIVVGNFKVLSNRMILLKNTIENLSNQAQTVYADMFGSNQNNTPGKIADIAVNVTDGVHNTIVDDPEGDYLLLSCKNIKGGHLNIGGSERRINKETFEKLRKRTNLSKGDVLLSSVGTVGEVVVLNTDPLNFEFQRSVAIIKPNTELVSSEYLYELLTYNKAALINAAHGAVQQCLFISDICEFPIMIPDHNDLDRFNKIVKPIFRAINIYEREYQALSALREVLVESFTFKQ